ncbi:MAG: hypothetical protein ACI9BV_003920, partial [Rhodothermales bacterium]
WNRSKGDPARMESFGRIAAAALEKVGEHLAGVKSLPSRAQFLDMARLTRDLRPDALGSIRGLGARLHALQFLDFHV